MITNEKIKKITIYSKITIYTIQSHVFLEQVMYSYKNYCILIISNKRLEKCCALRKIIYT